jgi:RND superfamily putative drug exporter
VSLDVHEPDMTTSADRATNGGVWSRIADLVVSHPVRVFFVAMLLLVPPLIALPFMSLSNNTLAELPAGTESVRGYDTLGEHFAPGEISPVILVVDADEPITDPASFLALGDLSRNLKRLDAVATVRSAAMPTNGVLPETADTDGAEQIAAFGDQLQQAADGAGQIADGLAQVRAGLTEIDGRLPELHSGLGDARAGAEQMLAGTADLREGIGLLDDGMDELLSGLGEARDGAGRLRTEVAIPATEAAEEAWQALSGFTIGVADPNYEEAATEVGRTYGLLTGRDPRTGQQVDPDYDGLAPALAELEDGLAEAVTGVGELRAGLGELDGGVALLADGLRQLADGLGQGEPGVAELQQGIDQLLDGVTRLEGGAGQLRTGLAEGAAQIADSGIEDLLPTGDTDSGPFVITPGILQAMPEVRDQLDFFLADDDTRTRVFVGLQTQPFTPEAMAAVRDMEDLARLSLQGSPLADAEVYATGLPAFLGDLDEVAARDFPILVGAVVLGVFLVLVLLLRAIVAPVYLVLTVLLSFGSALGFATIVFQGILGHPGLAWWVPSFLFVLLVALGADYNIYLMSRVREEAEHVNTVEAVRRATRSTGSVITSAGLILAGTFAAMMVADMSSMTQMGFATTVGILLDTFVVRTLLVPSIATMFGRRNWWPSKRSHAAAEPAG